MLKILFVASALTLACTNLASAGGDPSPGAVSESATILGTVNVAAANLAIASVGLGGGTTLTGTTLTGTTATVTRTPTGDIVVTSDTGSTFTVLAGYLAELILAYFT
jgi:hypothetical protein